MPILLKKFGVTTLPRYSPPEIACVYAFDMSDDTVKIGLTTKFEERTKSVQAAVYLKVTRHHHTGFAPLEFMRVIEARCHATFADRRVRGEYFAISFEEAVAELDRHAEDISKALAQADENSIDEFNYYEELKRKYFSTPKIVKPAPASASPIEKVRLSLTACVYALLMSNGAVYIDYADSRRKRFAKIEQKSGLTVKDTYFTFSMSHETAHLIAWISKKNFSSFRTEGEFFNVDFAKVCEYIEPFIKAEVERSIVLLKITSLKNEIPEEKTVERALLMEAAKFYVGNILEQPVD